MSLKKSIILLLIFFTILFIILLISEDPFKTEYERIKQEFPRLETNDSLNDRVLSIYVSSLLKNDKNEAAVILYNGRKIRIIVKYGEHSLDGKLDINDRLIKNIGSDTLYIDKAITSKRFDYFFVLQNTK